MLVPTHRVAWNVVPLFAAADTSSEQVSQVSWGSGLRILDRAGVFSQVIGEDDYTGWVRTEMIAEAADDGDSAVSTVATMFAEVHAQPSADSQLLTRLTLGSRVVLSQLPSVVGFIPIKFRNGQIGYVHEGQISITFTPSVLNLNPFALENTSVDLVSSLILENVARTSRYFIGIPYLWGGTTPFGLDCSGFTQLIYKINGMQLLRDSGQQWTDRRFSPVDCTGGLSASNFVESDLLFFGRSDDGSIKITHVGLALGDGSFVHSVGKGRGNIRTSCGDPEFVETFIGARRLNSQIGLSIDAAY